MYHSYLYEVSEVSGSLVRDIIVPYVKTCHLKHIITAADQG